MIGDLVVAESTLEVPGGGAAEWRIGCTARLTLQTPDCRVHRPGYAVRLLPEGSRKAITLAIEPGSATAVRVDHLPAGGCRLCIVPLRGRTAEGRALEGRGQLGKGDNVASWPCPACADDQGASIRIGPGW
jgi:hypothetical protein